MTRRRLGWSAALAAFAALLLGLSACSSSGGESGSPTGSGGASAPPTGGSSSSGSGGSGSGSAASGGEVGQKTLTADEAGQLIIKQLGPMPVLTGTTTRGIANKVIKIGSVATDTKAGQHTQPGICDGAKARFERANTEGGVNGYTFDFIGCKDDTAQPTVAQQAVQDLVEGEKVFAVVMFNSATGNLGSYFADQKVPYFGYLGADYCGWADKPYGASEIGESTCADPLPGKTVVNTAGIQAYLKASGKKASDIKMALFCNSDPYGKAGLANMKAAAIAAGIDVVFDEQDLPSATEPPLTDFSPVATKLLNAQPNLIWSGVTAPATLGTFGALKAQGYSGTLLWGAGQATLLQDPGTAATMDGVWGYTASGNLAYGAAPLTQVTADMKAINSTWAADAAGTLGAYWSADLFLQALKQVSGDVTAEKLMNVVNQGGFDYKGIDGVTCSQSWPAGRVLGPACAGALVYDAAAKKLDGKLPLQNIGGYLIQNK